MAEIKIKPLKWKWETNQSIWWGKKRKDEYWSAWVWPGVEFAIYKSQIGYCASLCQTTGGLIASVAQCATVDEARDACAAHLRRLVEDWLECV